MLRLSLVIFLVLSPALQALPTASVKKSIQRLEKNEGAVEKLLLPYAFSTESMGAVFGLGYMRRGLYQSQMTTAVTAFAGSESSAFAFGIWDFKPLEQGRFFLSVISMLGDYPRNIAYAVPSDTPINVNQVRPGANNSSADIFIERPGRSNFMDIKMEWMLPMGAAKQDAIMPYRLKGGLLESGASGGETWNPWLGGVSVAVIRNFNRYQSYESEQSFVDTNTHGLEIGLLYDNTDFPVNPSSGSRQYIAIAGENAWASSKKKWHAFTMESSHYFSLGRSSYARQRVLAFNAWAAYSPSWKYVQQADGSEIIEDAAPYNQAATLGGFYRLRGFNNNRFHDKAAVYTTAEYRYTLEVNPAEGVDWLRFLKLDWLQLVPFVEAGRVAPNIQSETLFTDWKYDVGLGIRGLFAGTVLRLDVVESEEGTALWAMVGHPF